MSDTKVYIYYIHNEIYAFTINKEYRKMFKEQRCMKVFHEEVLKMDDIHLSLFMNKNRYLMLTKLPLYDGKRYYEILGTQTEDDLITQKCDEMYEKMINAKEKLSKIPLKKKYKNLINSLSEMTELTKLNKDMPDSIESNYENLYTINMVYLFYKTFEKTFNEREEM